MNIAILLSGGTGSRLKAAVPKQYLKIREKMILTYSFETLLHHPQIDGILIVADEMWQKEILSELDRQVFRNSRKKFLGFVLPGETRQFSIYNALLELKKRTDILKQNVLIHDAARPNVSPELITNCIHALELHEGVMPVLSMKDTIYLSEDGIAISGLLDRNKLFAGQAPEGFHFNSYLSANNALLPYALREINGSTEVAVRAGMDVTMILGDENNYKITTQKDLQRFQEERNEIVT